ncbi:MAG: ATP-binding protein [Xanthomonadaceae bacterium]|nr:ATP-binding protein [Xanthomonadaceae bacterium]
MQSHTDTRVQALSQAFALFNDTSRALADSYHELERRAADLSRQLAAAHSARLSELAAKERLAERMQTLIEALPGGVVVLDASRRVVEANAAARGIVADLAPGQDWSEAAARTFGPMAESGRLQLPDGREFALSQQVLADGGMVLLFADVTRARELQARLEHYQRLSSMGEMSARLAHQLRTPLSAAVLYASRIAEGELPPSVATRLGARTMERLRHLERLIDDMLHFARADHDGREQVAVAELLARVRDAALGKSDAAVAVEFVDRSGAAVLNGSSELLASALGNLIDNALSVSPRGTQVRVQAERSAGEVAIRVADSGPGVPEALRERIFEPFFTTRADGTGLGLAVVRSVIAAHGGRVGVAARAQGGAEFEIRLPEAHAEVALRSGARVTGGGTALTRGVA